MKKTITKGILLAILILTIACSATIAQSTMANPPQYKDFVGENPDADADIKLVRDYMSKLVAGDVDMAISMLASDFKGYGPGPGDSSTAQKIAEAWKEYSTTHQNRKDEFVEATFDVKSGIHAGHWVERWGTYSFSLNGKDVKIPYQHSVHLKNGKIDLDIIYYDRLSMLQSLGYTLTPPTK